MAKTFSTPIALLGVEKALPPFCCGKQREQGRDRQRDLCFLALCSGESRLTCSPSMEAQGTQQWRRGSCWVHIVPPGLHAAVGPHGNAVQTLG